MRKNLVLASQSPRRRELMALVTPVFAVDEAAVDEAAVAAGLGKCRPAVLAEALACAKAADVHGRRPMDVVIGCDTVVELDGAVLGKPKNAARAVEMLTALAGRRHLVHTGVCVCGAGFAPARFTETTAVWFAPMPPHEIAAYARTEEPYDKAGAYGVQGWAARYITRLEGCYYNVMGLPVAALHGALRQLGVL